MKKFITYTSILALFLVIGTESYAQYCSPRTSRDWREIDAITTVGAIQDVSVQGITWSNGYVDRTTSARLIVEPGLTFQMNVSFDQSWSTGGNRVRVFLDYGQDGSFSQSSDLIYQGNSFAHPQQFALNITNNMSLINSGVTRMRITGFGTTTNDPCYTRASYGNAVDIEVLMPPNYSARVNSLISPETPICPGQLYQDLKVRICNDGLEKFDSVQVGGIYKTTASNGAPLPPISVPNIWCTDSVQPGDCKDVKVFTHAPGFKTGDTIIVWVANPNNVPDSMNIRDTVMFVVPPFIQKKLWTVGDTSTAAAGGPNDFLTLNMALDSFAIIGGICDSLIIEIDSSHNGRYDQYDFPYLAGAGPNSPIIVRPKPNQDNALLRFDSCDVDNNFIVRLDGLNHIIFDRIDFYSIDGNGTNHSHNIFMENGTHDISFIDCGFEADYANNDRDNSLIKGENVGDNIAIWDCDFEGGSDGIFISGGSSHEVSGCDFRGTYLASIHFEKASNIRIEDNDMRSLSTNIYNGSAHSSMGIGIFLDKISDDLFVNDNFVGSSNSQWPKFGIYIADYNKASGTNWIYNNMLNIGQPWSSIEFRGISIRNSSFTQVANNNIALNGNNNNNEGMFYNLGTGNAMWNNVIEIGVAGVAVRHNSFGEVTKSDYNNFYAPGNNIVAIGGTGGGTWTSLAAYQNATSLDMNSYQLNPFYYNTKRNDLHVCNNALSKAGFAIAAISDDFDGDVRSATTPSIGADEFTPISDVKLANDYGLCPGDTTQLTAGQGNFGETAIWKSVSTGNTIDTNQWIDVTMPGQYAVTFFNACGVVVDTIEIIQPDAVSLPNDTNMCFGTTLNVDATIVNGTAYVWSTTDSTATVALTEQATYTVTATDKWGCVSSDQFDVTYSPAADFKIDTIIVCEGASVNITSNVDGTIGATFTWEGYSGGSTNRDPGATISDFELPSKSAYVKVTVNHKGCISEDSILVNTLGRPVIDIADTTNGLLYKVTGNNSPGSNHSWDFGDGDTSNFRMPKHIYAKDGIYTVKYTNSNQCRSKDTTFEVSVMTLSLFEGTGEGASMSLYPNPNNGVFTLGFNGLDAQSLSVSIIDVNGRTVYNNELGSLFGNREEVVALKDVAPGFYTIKVELDGDTYQQKFIVE